MQNHPPPPLFPKLFWLKGREDEPCFTIEHHITEAINEGLKQITLVGAKKAINSDMVFCGFDYSSFFRDACGKTCTAYFPCNGRSGKCKYSRNLMELAGVELTIKL